MLYIFGFEGAPFIKIGFTRVDVWMRAANGFWACNHPSALCRQLGFERLRLLGLFNGTIADEQMVHQMIPGPVGPECEFYDAVWEKPVLLILAFLLTELPQPPKPLVPPQVERAIEYLPCCSNQVWVCNDCGEVFRRRHHWLQHQTTHEEAAFMCPECNKRFTRKGNLQRHQRSQH